MATIDINQNINHKLELSIAVELLTSRVDTALEMWRIDPDWQSEADWEDVIKCINFISRMKGKPYMASAKHEIEDYFRI